MNWEKQSQSQSFWNPSVQVSYTESSSYAFHATP